MLFFLLSTFLLALSKIGDTDAWLHLSMGRLIWSLKGLPENEPFVYTMINEPFSYSSWFFGLVYYTAYNLFNVDGVILLKAATVTIAFYILLMDALRPYKNHIITIVIMSFVVLVAKHRFVERPDTFLMLFIPFTIFSLNAFIYENRKFIYVLPFIHIIWANSHSSIILMGVPFLSFIIGGILQRYFGNKGMRFLATPSVSQLKTIMLFFTLSFIGSLVSPYGLSQYAFGPKTLTFQKQLNMEYFPTTWENDKWPYIITLIIAITFLLCWFKAYRQKTANTDIRYPSIIHLILVIPFILLAFKVGRFGFLLAIVAGPILIRNLSALLNTERWSRLSLRKEVLIALTLWTFLYLPFVLPRLGASLDYKAFGSGIESFVPEDALKYMDARGITGRILNELGWGSYIIWRDFPKRMVFIDPRWNISPDLFEKYYVALDRPSVLADLERKYGFESILIPYPDVSGLKKDTFSDTEWALVYWDDISLLYLKRGGRYDSIIKTDEYKFIKPADTASIFKALLIDVNFRSYLIGDLNRNILETGSSKAKMLLGSVYNEMGFFKEAIDSFSKIKESPYNKTILFEAHKGMAYAHNKLGDTDKSIEYYKKALGINKDATILYALGMVYAQNGDKKAAMMYLKKALDMNKEFIEAYPSLIEIYSELGKEGEVRKVTKLYQEAKNTIAAAKHFEQGVEAYRKRNYLLAIDEFNKSIELSPSDPHTYSNLGYVYYDMGMFDKALEYQKKALTIEPNLAYAHYGLALIYKRRGDLEKAVKHMDEYVKHESLRNIPEWAKEEIGAIKRGR